MESKGLTFSLYISWMKYLHTTPNLLNYTHCMDLRELQWLTTPRRGSVSSVEEVGLSRPTDTISPPDLDSTPKVRTGVLTSPSTVSLIPTKGKDDDHIA